MLGIFHEPAEGGRRRGLSVAALPGGDSTKNLLNAERFTAMKRGCLFYNIGRGTSVDQDASSRKAHQCFVFHHQD